MQKRKSLGFRRATALKFSRKSIFDPNQPMKKILTISFAVLVFFSATTFAQISTPILVSIVKAEDERRFDKTLEDLMKNADAKIRARAALAAGRIGDEPAVAPLINLLETDSSDEVRTMAAFALGEIESIKAAEAIIKSSGNTKTNSEIRARAIEAAGKIAAANAKDEKSKQLGEAILQLLRFEDEKRSGPYEMIIAFGLTATLRARPADAETTLIRFIDAYTPQIRANALNALARLRAKNANEKSRELLQKDADAIVRANAARVLGAAEDADSFDSLLKAATADTDSRVRVSAIRSIGSLKNAKAADELLKRGENLLKAYKKEFYAVAPAEKNELLEIATTLGRILPNSDNEKALVFLNNFGLKDSFNSSEIHIAVARISPSNFLKISVPEFICHVNYARVTPSCWQFYSARAQGLSELANLDEKNSLRAKAADILQEQLKSYRKYEFATDRITEQAIPDTLRAFANFKTADLPEVLRDFLKYSDVFARATAAELIGDLPPSEENVRALKTAFGQAISIQELTADKYYNDAQLAIITALAKQDKEKETIKLLFPMALQADDYMVRRHTAIVIKEYNLDKDVPEVKTSPVNVVLPKFKTRYTTKLGRILNTNADYMRAVKRKSARAILTTDKGTFTIEFFPEAAPLTVDNFIKLAKANYFNGLMIHRVVPNFVMQDGDPRGDGNGGPGWQIRCELNMREYERGAVGMALSGKDTGGSQWFVTHSPQPHLDGGYTVFGRVNETDMKVVDNLVRGDKILTVKIVEGNSPQKRTK